MNLKMTFLFPGLLFTLAILSGFSRTSAQVTESKINLPVRNSFESYKKISSQNFEKAVKPAVSEIETAINSDDYFIECKPTKMIFAPVETEKERRAAEKNTDQAEMKNFYAGEISSQIKDEEKKEKFHWKPALIQSGIFLGIQHSYRLTQQRTKRELGGPFFRDWARSVKGLRGWKDPDNFFINYVLHSLQGGLTGRIFVNNSDRAKKQEFGRSKKYWTSRFKAMVWSTVWSTQFELGPISEASIGNVGLREKRGRSTMAYVDLVVTPVLGTGIVIGEDAIDKYILKNWVERNATKTKTTFKIRVLRSFLTPTTTIGNLLRGKEPWKRENR